jgi:hypothetical protein
MHEPPLDIDDDVLAAAKNLREHRTDRWESDFGSGPGQLCFTGRRE